ncbi:MAG: ribosome-associated translation inhibitor RaiA [Ruminococcus sp.]|jgi:putative sigma-54 modulation protein|nr:ribosome-associated translation inhibitor RaiA [Ruminococcus sp.]
MKLNIIAKKITVSQEFSSRAEKKLSKLDKFFGSEADAKIVLSELKNKNKIIVELTVRSEGILYRAEMNDASKTTALDNCIDVIIKQIIKNKTKVKKHLKEGSLDEYINVPDEKNDNDYEVIKTKEVGIIPMTVQEAILQMNMLGHNFFMFEDAVSGLINVVYKRKDDDYAVLVPLKK